MLLTDLAAQAGPALANVRLAADLRAQAEELRASRQRIVSAQDAERRRIERDLHDGAQQHLVAMAVNLQLVGEIIRHDPAEAEAVLAGVRAEVNEALQTLRDLARGIYPPALAEHGILAALEAHVARMRPMPRLEPDPAVLGQRYASDVEAAVFFCVLEALQNCAKHAPGSAVSVRLFSGERGLAFCVADDGPGFDPATRLGAGGLRGMADRLAAVGGSLSVRSAPGQGTTIVGCLPQLSSTSST